MGERYRWIGLRPTAQKPKEGQKPRPPTVLHREDKTVPQRSRSASLASSSASTKYHALHVPGQDFPLLFPLLVPQAGGTFHPETRHSAPRSCPGTRCLAASSFHHLGEPRDALRGSRTHRAEALEELGKAWALTSQAYKASFPKPQGFTAPIKQDFLCGF